ncbi:MAG: YceI family protein [Myxococcales bacterium]
MKMALAALLLAAPAFAATVELDSDPNHTTASFAIKHMMVNTVRGEFSKANATLNWDKDDPTRSSVTAKIEAASIDTHNEKRDGHLKSPDFFDAGKCPEITFKSTKIEKSGGDKYKVTGDLTMHCQTHPATFEATFTPNPIKAPWGALVYVGNGTTTVKRSEWGLKWNKPLDQAGGMLVGDEVKFEIDAEFAQKQAAKKEAAAETKK